MSKLQWDKVGERLYETGVDRGVLFPMGRNGTYDKGVAWSGLTAINESPSGGEANPFYADNVKYLNLMSAESFGFSIEAYTYPDEWEACDGSIELAPGLTAGQQSRKVFGLAYRTLIGNDVDGQDHGYKIHLVYGAQASPSGRDHGTVNESPEPTSMSWEATTTPVEVPGAKRSAHLVINSTKTPADKLAALEAILYGTESENSRLPMPEEIIALMGDAVTVIVAAESASATLLGKQVSELQTGVVVGADSISGSLKNVTGYTGFSSKTSEQSGHYLALKFETEPADAVTTVQLIGGTSGPVTLDADRNIVLLIKNKDTQSVKVVSTKDGQSITKVYGLTGLTLEA